MKFNSQKHRLPAFKNDGILLIDKPKTWTSFDVVNALRWQFNIGKIGHCGTLDPAATGLLVIVIGRFTKLSEKFSGDDKTYEATMLLGTETDSQDMDGKIIAEKDFSNITEAQIKEVISQFLGDQKQVPPMVSAIKKEGKKLYELARQGIEIEREPKSIKIYSIEITRVQIPYVDFVVKCSKGTYIRTLCSDIGKKLGCGATLFGLRRTQSGIFDIQNAVSVETAKNWTAEELTQNLDLQLAQALKKIKI